MDRDQRVGLDMTQRGRRKVFEQALVVAAAMTAAIICGLSYLADASHREKFDSSNQIDLLEGNLTGHWAVFGALSAAQVSFNRINDGSVEVKIRADNPSWSAVSSGVSYRVGLPSPGWYEFEGEFQADANPLKGVGAQLEVRSDRWRAVFSAVQPHGSTWQTINVYFRPSYADPGADISCRFWGGTGDPAGRALFRNVRLVRIAGDPPPKAPRFDLAKQEEARLGRLGRQFNGSIPPGRRTGLGRFGGAAVTVLFLGMIVGISWWLLA